MSHICLKKALSKVISETQYVIIDGSRCFRIRNLGPDPQLPMKPWTRPRTSVSLSFFSWEMDTSPNWNITACCLEDQKLYTVCIDKASSVMQWGIHPPVQEMQETQVQSLGREEPQRRKRKPTPVFLLRNVHGQRHLVGYSAVITIVRQDEWLSTLNYTGEDVCILLYIIFIMHIKTGKNQAAQVWGILFMRIGDNFISDHFYIFFTHIK